jgi:YD repeat-containing protein
VGLCSYAQTMALADELEEVVARTGADAILAAEARPAERIYVCSFAEADGGRTWQAYDAAGRAVTDRRRLRDAVSIAALCELAEETAGGGDLDELRSQLAALRITESPPGIEEAEEAALELQRVLGAPPMLATPARLDEIGAAVRRLEVALGGAAQGSPFSAAMKASSAVVESLCADVERSYRGALS